MAITNSIARFPGVGGVLTAKTAVALSGTVQQTSTVTFAQPQATSSCGWVRVKVTNGGGTTPTCAAIIQLTDGTGTVIIGQFPALTIPLVATSGVDFIFEYNIDLNATSVSVLTTLGGTGPTATLDWEVFALP